MRVLGIDFGSAFVRVATLSTAARLPELVTFGDGSRALPAVASADRGALRVGRSAVGRAASHPQLTVRSVKRLLGRTAEDPLARAALSRAGYTTSTSANGQLQLLLGDVAYEPEQIAAALFKAAADAVLAANDEAIELAVVAVPHWFGPTERRALTRAAERAGLRVAPLLSEATATALSLKEYEPEPRVIAVVDVGAVACTASILEVSTKRVELVASICEPGGGDDVDASLVRAMLRGLMARTGQFESTPSVFEMLRQVAEGLGRDLAQASQATAVIPFLPVGAGLQNQEVVVTRDVFERVLASVAARVERACKRVLEAAGMDGKRLSAVYATGGPLRFGAPRAAVESVFGRITGRRLDPEGAIALGAALQAGMLCGLAESIPVIDVHAATSLTAPTERASLPPLSGRPPGTPSVAPRSVSSEQPAVTSARAPVASDPVARRALQSELADLLAAIGAGALTSESGSRDARAVGRAEDVDVDEIVDPGAMATVVSRLESIWHKLGIAMQTVRQYGWEHPQSGKQIGAAFDEIGRALVEMPRSVQFEVGPVSFSRHGRAVYTPERAPFDAIPYELFAAGIRRVQLKPGLTTAELSDFLGVLLRDAARGFGADDDLGTALWERKYRHIAYVAIDTFAESDDPAFELERDRLTSELSSTFSVGDDAALDAFFDAQRRIADVVGARTVDAAMTKELAAGADPGPAAWLARYAELVVRAVQSSDASVGAGLSATLRRWSEAQLAAHAERAVCELEGALTEAGAERTVLDAVLGEAAVRTLIERASERGSAEPPIVATLSRAIEREPGDGLLELAVSRCAGAPAEICDSLIEYLGRRARGHEELVASVLPKLGAEHARRLLEGLARASGEKIGSAAEHALASPHWDVRITALRLVGPSPSPRARDEMQLMLDDPDPACRMQVLTVIRERALSALGPSLVRRIEADSFHGLPLDERRLLLEVVARLNPRRAEDLAISLLGRRHVVSSDAAEHSRALAAEFLARGDSPESLRVLEEIAKKRWGNSQLVREAATKAVQRRSLRPPGGSR